MDAQVVGEIVVETEDKSKQEKNMRRSYSVLISKFVCDNYNEVVKIINQQATDLGLKGYHHLWTNLPVVEPVSCENDPDEPPVLLLGRN